MLQNVIAGLQGLIDHILVGNLLGYTANAAIGVSWQIFLVVIVFMASLFTGQAVLVARYVGAGDADKVNRTVQQALLTALAMYAVMAPIGYFGSPYLLDFANASPAVRELAMPFLRVNFTFSIGMLLFFMLTTALRAAGDARTPMRLGVTMTILNVVLNLILIRGLGPIPALGTMGSALGTVIASSTVSAYALYQLLRGRLVIKLSRHMDWRPDWVIIRSLFRFGLPTGVQGIAMNIAGVMLLRFIGSLEQSAEAQGAYAIGYTELFSLITWTSVGLMFVAFPEALLWLFGATDPAVQTIGEELLQYLAISGFFITLALTYTGGLQGTGDTRSPLFITLASQIAVPIGMCTVIQSMRQLQPEDIWLAIVLGHFTRCVLTVYRFRQGKWRTITVTH